MEQLVAADADREELFVDEIDERKVGEHIARCDGESFVGQKIEVADASSERV